MSEIHVSAHHAMTTWWQVQIANEAPDYAQQAAQAAFQVTDHMESLLSRFRPESEISMIAELEAGSRLRLSEPVFECLRLAKEIEASTAGAFKVGFDADWQIDSQTHEFFAKTARCKLDLGAIGKGFALDRMAAELADWGIEKFLLLSSASSILAGQAPEGKEGWPVRIGGMERDLTNAAVGTSGTSMKGNHILDPRTGAPSAKYERTWALAPTAAEADALSTAFMNMQWGAIDALCSTHPSFAAVVQTTDGLLTTLPTL